MGKIASVDSQRKMGSFIRSLLRDVESLEFMLQNDWFEADVTRIGAEQEMFLVDAKTMKPAPVNLEVLEKMGHCSWLKPELAKFNLEANMTPREFTQRCLSEMEAECAEYLNAIRGCAQTIGADVALAGVLPTLHRYDVEMHNLTPKKRYQELLDATKEMLNGESYKLHIVGIDELILRQHSSLLPACSTSFQVHFQVAPDDFCRYYNIAQALAAPILAIAANSPLVFGKRLWHESRMILYQQASDTRIPQKYLRERRARVSFGNEWLEGSVLDIYREDICRYRALLGSEIDEDPMAEIRQGRVPSLKALQVHNSTVYRWNRPCYGVSPNGRPHLRIENRIISAGPTVIDEVANAAFWLGLMVGMADSIDDVRDHIPFSDIKDNFWKAAKYGLHTEFNWLNNKKLSSRDLILNDLLPMAKSGLETRGIDSDDIDRYLGVIEARTKGYLNGANWTLNAYHQIVGNSTKEKAAAYLTSSILENQWQEKPVHTWGPPQPTDLGKYHFSALKVEDFMQTDLITVRSDDVIELAASIMKWKGVGCIAVEDGRGRLLGLVSIADIPDVWAQEDCSTVSRIMNSRPLVTRPDENIKTAEELMEMHQVEYLPVVCSGILVGMITKNECLNIRNESSREMETLRANLLM